MAQDMEQARKVELLPGWLKIALDTAASRAAQLPKWLTRQDEKNIGPHDHHWRVVKCDGERDVCECSKCGRQQEFACDFDDEYS